MNALRLIKMYSYLYYLASFLFELEILQQNIFFAKKIYFLKVVLVQQV